MTDATSIRPLGTADLDELVELCGEHAAYERARFAGEGLAERLRDTLLGPDARAMCFAVEAAEELAGYAVVAPEFSTWDGRCYYHMDCLYLRPDFRGRGLGEALMREVSRTALHGGAVQVQWQTPDWNTAAAGFYARLGAVAQPKLRFSLPAEACRRLAGPGAAPRNGRHRERAIRMAALEDVGPWRIKRYEITLDGAPVAEDVIRAARARLIDVLPEPEPKPALGFVVVHRGEDACWLLVCWWETEILYQRMFAAPTRAPSEFQPVPADGPTGCVWELRVHANERDAWVRTILDPPEGPDVEAWARDVLAVRAGP